MKLVEIAPPHYDVKHEIAYATANNFTGKPVYGRAGCYLHQDAAEALERAIKYAAGMGLRFKIFDAYRPPEAQFKLWEHTPDPNFLAHPERGSPHSRGVAVDLTLIDASGAELNMGTEFDAFTSLSHHRCVEVTGQAQQNRLILLGIMTLAGFDFYSNEWWHYQLFNSRNYDLIPDGVAVPNMM
jgi:D-alanyl-D-alanine dipeptidase